MKTRIYLFTVLLLLCCMNAMSIEAKSAEVFSPDSSVKVYTSPDLHNLTTKWVNAYGTLNPQVKIQIAEASGNKSSDIIASGEGIGFYSEDSYPSTGNRSLRSMIIGRNIIVPIMNAKNPFLNEICKIGINSKTLAQILESPESRNWGSLLGNAQKLPLHFYVINDQFTELGLKGFLNANQDGMAVFQILNDQEIISAIQNDPYAIGFCKLTQITDSQNQNLMEGIKLVPIDKNGNGKIDYMEDIYDNLQLFTRGVWIGKYPKALSANIYSVSAINPNNVSEVAFLKWVITDGQQFLNENGYTDLVYNERLAQLSKFGESDLYADIPVKSTNTVMSVLLLVIIVIVITGVIVELVFRRIRRRDVVLQGNVSASMRVFNEDSVIIPKGLYFDKTHSWAFMRKNGLVKIGIDDFLQHVTGKITRVEMKSVGEVVKKGDHLLSIVRKGKQVSIYSPISGTITEINKNLITNSSLLNSAPYSEGWVYLVEPTNWGLELQYLTIAENFRAGLTNEFLRLKDFFSTVLKENSADFAYVTMQDGGTLLDNPLAELGPDVWDDFQTRFIDASK